MIYMKQAQSQYLVLLIMTLLLANYTQSISLSSSLEAIIDWKSSGSFTILDQRKDLMDQSHLKRGYQKVHGILKGYSIDNYTIPFQNLQGNFMISDGYLLIPLNLKTHPGINRINLKTMAVERFQYPNIDQWMYHEHSLNLFALPTRQEIVFGANRYTLIMDKQTLQIKQIITSSQYYQVVRRFHKFTDPQTSESRVLVKKHSSNTISERLYELKKDFKTGKYSQTLLGFSQDILQEAGFDFAMTGLNKAVSIYGRGIYYWENFNEIIDKSTKLKYALIDRQKIAVSYSEYYFVMRFSSNNNYEFYHLDENYEVKMEKQIYIGYNQHIRGEFTSDDKHMFVLMRTPKKVFNIAKIIVEKGQFSLVKDSSGNPDNHLDFNLFAAETDRMVVLVLKGTDYALQLRTISNLSIIHEIPISFNFTVLQIKLVGNIEWGLNFAVTAQYIDNYYADADSNLRQFSISDDKIVQTGVNSPVAYDYHYACSKYLVLYHLRNQDLTIFHSSTFKTAAIKHIGSYQRVLFEKNIMTLGSLNVEYYDLSKSLDSQGFFFKELEQMAQRQHFLFPKRRLALDIASKIYYTDQISRILLDISKLQVRSIAFFESIEQQVYEPIYYHPLDNSCDKIYYTEYSDDYAQKNALGEPFWYRNPSIGSFDQCTKQAQTYPLGVKHYCRTKNMLSSDKKYHFIFIQTYKKVQNVDFSLQIRLRENLGKVVFSKQFSFGQLYIQRDSMDYIIGDLIDDSRLIIKSQKFVYTETINQNQAKIKEKGEKF